MKQKNGKYKRYTIVTKDANDIKTNRGRLFKTSLILAIAVIPISMYYNIMQCIRASVYGYRSLYYGGVMDDIGGWVSLMNRMFIPCILGLAIGSGNDIKKETLYILFFLFTQLSAWRLAIVVVGYTHL